MPNEQGKGMRRQIAAESSGRLARCAAARRSVDSLIPLPKITLTGPRASTSTAHRPFLRGCPQATTSAVVRRYGGIGYLSPLRLAVPPRSLPPSFPASDCYLPISYRPSESLPNREGRGERGSEQTMEETEGRTFTFAILSFSSAARSPRPASEESGYGVGNLVTHMRPTPRSVGRGVECEGYKLASSETANMIATEG